MLLRHAVLDWVPCQPVVSLPVFRVSVSTAKPSLHTFMEWWYGVIKRSDDDHSWVTSPPVSPTLQYMHTRCTKLQWTTKQCKFTIGDNTETTHVLIVRKKYLHNLQKIHQHCSLTNKHVNMLLVSPKLLAYTCRVMQIITLPVEGNNMQAPYLFLSF